MIKFVKPTILILAALLAALALAAPTAANAPKGQGLTTLATEGITSLTCSDPSISVEDVLLPRGGGAATWLTDGRMYLVQSIHVEGTVTTPDGSFPISFSKTYGQRIGLAAETVTCTFEQVLPEMGVEASGTVTLVRVG